MKPLDIVRTSKGSIGLITETNNLGKNASVTFINKLNLANEKTAWWDENELEVIDNLPRLLASCFCHPFGNGNEDVDYFYKND